MYIFGKIWPTTRLLREKLECRAGLRLTRVRKRGLVINWGRHTDFSDCLNVLNRHIVTNKFRELLILSNNDSSRNNWNRDTIDVPDYYKHDGNTPDLEYPILGRKFNHSQGRDIIKYDTLEDWENREQEHEYYIEYIEKKGEYRVHVLGSTVGCITKKKRIDGEEQDEIIWNHKKGWKQIRYRNDGRYYERLTDLGISAVRALGYDFGAVDIIVGQDEILYVLEVNSAPGLIDIRAEMYIEYFRRIENGI